MSMYGLMLNDVSFFWFVCGGGGRGGNAKRFQISVQFPENCQASIVIVFLSPLNVN